MKQTKWVRKIICVSTILTPFVGASAFLITSCSKAKRTSVDIVQANDIHGALGQSSLHPEITDRAPAIDCLLNEYLKIANANPAQLVLNGDIIQGSNMTVFSENVGEWTWNVLKTLPYQYSSIGNHDVEWGIDKLLIDFHKEGHIDWLCANMFFDKNTKEKPQDYTIIPIGNLNVGLVGYTSVDAANQPFSVSQDYRVSDARDGQQGTQDLQTAIDNCWNNTDNIISPNVKPDTVLLLAHAGAVPFEGKSGQTPDPENPEYAKESEIFNVIHNINHIDGCLSSHSHYAYVLNVSDKDNKKIPVGHADWHCESLLDTKISYDEKSKDNVKVDMSIVNTHTEKTYDQLEYKQDPGLINTDETFNTYNEQTNEVNKTPALTVKANSKEDATIKQSETIDTYGEVPVAGNIFAKTMVKTLTRDRINSSDPNNPYKVTQDQMEKFNWFEGQNQYNGLDFYLDGDDTTQTSLSPSDLNTNDTYQGVYTFGDVTKPWVYYQTIYIVKATAKKLKDYYLTKNCNQKSDSYKIVDPIYSDKYILEFSGGNTIATSTDVDIINKETNQVVDDDQVLYIAMNSFMRDNRGKDYFSKYGVHDEKACVEVNVKWNPIHPVTHQPMDLNGYYGNAFAFIYSVKQLANDNAEFDIDLTDPSSIYHFDVTQHYKMSN